MNKRNQPSISTVQAHNQPSIAVKPRRIGTKTTASTPLTSKQKLFVKTLVNNPKLSATQAYLQAYNATTSGSAAVSAHHTLRKPNVYAYLSKFEQAAQDTIAEMALQRDDKRLAMDASRDILDRLNGKATQRTEAQATTVTIALDLTSGDSDS